jgi:hypothetical protein
METQSSAAQTRPEQRSAEQRAGCGARAALLPPNAASPHHSKPSKIPLHSRLHASSPACVVVLGCQKNPDPPGARRPELPALTSDQGQPAEMLRSVPRARSQGTHGAARSRPDQTSAPSNPCAPDSQARLASGPPSFFPRRDVDWLAGRSGIWRHEAADVDG